MAYGLAVPRASLTLSKKSIAFSCVNLRGSIIWRSGDSACRALRPQKIAMDSQARSPRSTLIEGAWAALARPVLVVSRLGR